MKHRKNIGDEYRDRSNSHTGDRQTLSAHTLHTLLITLSLTLTLTGCTTHTPTPPTIITETVTVEVPVKCKVNVPEKPHYNPRDIISIGKVMEYYNTIETLLRGCVEETK